MAEPHMCLFCGTAIERSTVDPCSAVLAVPTPPEDADRDSPRGRARARWWSRPPGQYWMHAACLRSAAHPSVDLHFLEAAEHE